MGEEVSDLGRFSDPALFILVSLAGGEKHGYAMMEDIEATCGVRLGPGTLYGALSRLEKRGLVEPLVSEAWRERYEEEFVALLEQRPASVTDLFDVALGALDAWLRPQAASERRTVVLDRMRKSVLVVLWAWVGLVVAGVGFRKMTEYEDFVRVARENALVGAASDAVVIGAVLALVAVVVGGVSVSSPRCARRSPRGAGTCRSCFACRSSPSWYSSRTPSCS